MCKTVYTNMIYVPTKTSEKVNVVVNGRTVERTVYLVKGTRCYSKRDSTTHKTKYVPIGKTKQVGGYHHIENNAWQTSKKQVKQHTSILNNIDITKIKAEEKEQQHKRQSNVIQAYKASKEYDDISKDYDEKKNKQNAKNAQMMRSISKDYDEQKNKQNAKNAQIAGMNAQMMRSISKDYDEQKNKQNAAQIAGMNAQMMRSISKDYDEQKNKQNAKNAQIAGMNAQMMRSISKDYDEQKNKQNAGMKAQMNRHI